MATLIQISIPTHLPNRGPHPAYQLETIQGSVSSWSLTFPLFWSSDSCHHHHHQRCYKFWRTHFSSCWVTVWEFLMHNVQLRLSLLAPYHNSEVISLFQSYNVMWPLGYTLRNQCCLQSSAPGAQSGAEFFLWLYLSLHASLNTPGTLLLARCTFGFFAGQNANRLHFFFSEAVQKFKSTKYSSESDSFFF